MATIREVAKMSGVSTATVSHVLNGHTDRVSADTRERVFAAIRTLKYRPTPLERNQKAILTRNLAVVAQDMTESPLERSPYFRRILDGILEVAGFRGWSVTIFIQRMWGELDQVVRRSYDGRCDGVIVIAPEAENEIVRSLHERGTPLCLVGTSPWLDSTCAIDLDNRAAGELVARHLLALGHRRLAYFAVDLKIVSSRERWEGFKAAAYAAGVEVETILFPPYASMDHLAAMLARRGDSRPTGIMCWHDALARGLADALVKQGVNVPGDVSVVGVDDDPDSALSPPGLTTIPNPVRLLGKRAAAMLIDRLEAGNDGSPPEIVRLPPELIIRGTTGPAPDLCQSTRFSIPLQSVPTEVSQTQ